MDFIEDSLVVPDTDLTAMTRELTLQDPKLTNLIKSLRKPTGAHTKYAEADGILYEKGWILVPADAAL